MLEVWKWLSDVCNTKWQIVEKVDCFKFLGSQVTTDSGCERDVVHRMNEGYRACEALKTVLSNRGFGINVKIGVYMK